MERKSQPLGLQTATYKVLSLLMMPDPVPLRNLRAKFVEP
jgi:hypothetical protein